MEINFEFRKERKLGEIVQDFVNLVRLIFRHFFSTILKLSVIPLCLMLLLIYYGSTKINLNTSQSIFDNREVIILAILGVILFVFLSIVFYGFAIEYFLLLKNKGNTNFGVRDIWKAFISNFRKYFVFLLVAAVSLVILSIPLILMMALGFFIPIIGNFVFGIIVATVGVWYFCAFVFYREGYLEPHTTLQRTFKIIKSRIFDYGVSSYIVSFVFQAMLGMLMIVPSLILGISAYNIVGFNESFFDSFIGRMLSSIGLTLLILFYILYQMFSVLVSGIIYESAKEITYGENIYETIEKIGKGGHA